MKTITLCGVYHSKRNPFVFEFDDDGKITKEPGNLPKGVKEYAVCAFLGDSRGEDGYTGLADHNQCEPDCMKPKKGK